MPVQSVKEPRRPGPDSRLAEALIPLLETALKRSVQDNPQLWLKTICPILGPAIRMAAAAAVRDMAQMLNQLLENSLSLRSWRWRLEAWRTGKSFAEVVLLRTLVYKVEQILLVDRNSGLLLASVSAPGVVTEDSDLVSGMLIAIQTFIHDSFHLEQDDSIREIHTGEFSLWFEPGPVAAIAAAVRGNPPVELHQTLRAAVDLIHEEVGAEIRNFQNDSELLEQRSRPILEGCLQSQFQIQKPGYGKLCKCAAIVAAALLLWGGLHMLHSRQWNRALAALQATPGIAVTQATREHGKHIVKGLRDPFAASVGSVLAQNGISESDVSARFQPFLSLDPKLLIRRVSAAIDAPEGMSVWMDKGILRLEGAAPHEWIVRAREAAPKLALAGIREISTDHLQDRELEALRSEIEGVRILFDIGSSTLVPRQAQAIDDVAPKLRQWIAGARAIGRVPGVKVIGHADSTGGEIANLILTGQRAQQVTQALIAADIPSNSLNGVGAGPYPDAEDIAGAASADSARLRRNVVLQLSQEPDAAVREGH
jgi:outer membrane protein OmpA-like peptidoglycan-associated protein